MIPTLQTERLILAPFLLSDAPLVREYAGHPEVAAMTGNIPHPYPDDAAEKWIASHQLGFLEKKIVVFSIRSLEGALLGAIHLSMHLEHGRGEIGYWIGLPHWNRGICTEATARVIRYGFEELGMNRIHSCYLAINPASGKVMAKNGMKQEGVRRKHIIKNGVPMDLVECAILRSEYEGA